MRILLHDYGGYAFIASLSRALASRGHVVTHVYCGSVQTPQGLLQHQPGDPENLRFEPIVLAERIRKRSFVRRWRKERQYAAMLRELVGRVRPEIIVSADTPSAIQASLVRQSRSLGIRFVSWVQDLYGLAAYEILRKKLPGVGDLIGRRLMALDRLALRQSDAVVLITEAFRAHAKAAGVADSVIRVIPNWAPLQDLPLRPKDNPWSRKHHLEDRICFIYSGTLSMKHNPVLLLELARQFRDRPEVCVVVVSEGDSADWLGNQALETGVANLVILPFQPFADVPNVLAAAEVLVCILEPDAGRFSVPSKVLTYLCAGRGILLSVPAENLSAQTIESAKAGIVASPGDQAGFLAGAARLLANPELRGQMGQSGRRFAETNFDIHRIVDGFEEILKSAVQPEKNNRASASV
jgi:colanic acid biosynthesis glycosyl transferase WcaI